MNVAKFVRFVGVVGCGVVALAGCGNEDSPSPVTGHQRLVGPGLTRVPAPTLDPVPVEQATFVVGETPLTIWPYAGGGPVEEPSDPVNLVFSGAARPIDIRAALLSLNGDRSAIGLPPVFPFNARWSDATGGVQTAWSADGGWSAGTIQLQLGSYAPMRIPSGLPTNLIAVIEVDVDPGGRLKVSVQWTTPDRGRKGDPVVLVGRA